MTRGEPSAAVPAGPSVPAPSAPAQPGPFNPLLLGPGEYPFVTLDRMRPLKGKVAWIARGFFGVRFEPPMLEAGELLGLIKAEAAA